MQPSSISIFSNLITTAPTVTNRDIHQVSYNCSHTSSSHGGFVLRKNIITLDLALEGTPAGLPFAREFLKLSIRALMNFKSTRQWLAYWNSTPLHAEIASTSPYVLKKIFRPYLTNRLRSNERLSILTSHYDFITRHGLADLILRAAEAPVILSQFSGKSDSIYQIQLVIDNNMEREGEVVLQLVSDGSILFSVAFTFFNNTESPTVAIGCLQGGRASNCLDQIRFATRDMFGLRPKTLMVRLVQQIGRQYSCRNLLLVGNQNRAVTTQLRKGVVFANYDTTWQELGAALRPDGDFTLTCNALSEPDLQMIASSKRSEAKKRFALLSRVSKLTCQGLLR